jgi:hypothetical protein
MSAMPRSIAAVACPAGAGRACAVTVRPTSLDPVMSFMSWRIVPFLPVTISTASETDAG